MKKLLATLLICVMVFSLAGALADEEYKVIKALDGYDANHDQMTDVMYDKVTEITGFKVEWEDLPAENANQQLMLMIASGDSFDLLYRVTGTVVNELYKQGALLPLNDLIAEHGQDIIVSDMAWKMTTAEDGTIFAVPYVSYEGDANGYYYGGNHQGIGFNMALLKDLGYDALPTTLDEFVEICKAYTEKTGNPAMTYTANPWISAIMMAFEVPGSAWYIDKEAGTITPRVKMDGLKDYLKFMQMLYSEGYLDQDFPINTSSSAMEKLGNGTALCYGQYAFWNVLTTYPAFEAVGIENGYIENATGLKKTEDQVLHFGISQSYSSMCAIPVTAEHPELGMEYLNAITQIDNFREIFIGEEGYSYTLDDEGNYFPILPIFTEIYANSDRFVGIPQPGLAFKMWQARARKTETMAAIYDAAAAFSADQVPYNNYTGYASALPEKIEYEGWLNTMISDELMAAIASGEDADAVIARILEQWNDNGGPEVEAAMTAWYETYKDQLL